MSPDCDAWRIGHGAENPPRPGWPPPQTARAKLLRVLQERCFFRLERTTYSHFRSIAATNRDLYADMLADRFREDLFYRLAEFRITIPPLRAPGRHPLADRADPAADRGGAGQRSPCPSSFCAT
jgi:hypothetical protein